MSVKLAGMFLAGVIVGASVVAIANMGSVEYCYFKNKKNSSSDVKDTNSTSESETESNEMSEESNDKSESDITDKD